MANELTMLTHTILARGLMVLRESCLMPMLVNQEYSLAPKQKGQTIDVPISKVASTYDITPSHQDKQATGTDLDYVQVTLDQWKGTDFYLTDLERTRIAKEKFWLPSTVQEKVRALANAVNAHILSQYYGVYGFVGTAGTTPFSNSTDRTAAKDATQLYARLDDQLCPKVGRHAVIDTMAEAEALALPYFAHADKAGSQNVIELAQIGTKFGMNWFIENAIVSHTAGTPGGTPLVNGAHEAATNDLTDTLAVKGMTVTTGDYHQGDIITMAGHSQTYAVLADATADGSGNASLSIAPGLQAALSGDEAISLKASHTVNMAFNREAFAFATAPFEKDIMPGVEMAVVRDPVTGLVLRLEVKRQYKQTKWEFDILYGAKCVRPRFACRLAG